MIASFTFFFIMIWFIFLHHFYCLHLLNLFKGHTLLLLDLLLHNIPLVVFLGIKSKYLIALFIIVYYRIVYYLLLLLINWHQIHLLLTIFYHYSLLVANEQLLLLHLLHLSDFTVPDLLDHVADVRMTEATVAQDVALGLGDLELLGSFFTLYDNWLEVSLAVFALNHDVLNVLLLHLVRPQHKLRLRLNVDHVEVLLRYFHRHLLRLLKLLLRRHNELLLLTLLSDCLIFCHYLLALLLLHQLCDHLFICLDDLYILLSLWIKYNLRLLVGLLLWLYIIQIKHFDLFVQFFPILLIETLNDLLLSLLIAPKEKALDIEAKFTE